jgi:hypothetical protein
MFLFLVLTYYFCYFGLQTFTWISQNILQFISEKDSYLSGPLIIIYISMRWSVEKETRLVELWREHANLYNLELETYYNKVTKNESLKVLMNDLDCNGKCIIFFSLDIICMHQF